MPLRSILITQLLGIPLQMTPLYFDSTSLQELPVTIEDKHYFLREATAKVATTYKQSQISGASLNTKTKQVSIGNVGSGDLILLSSCMFLGTPSPDAQKVSQIFVESLPQRIYSELLSALKKLSGLSSDDEDDDNGDESGN